MCGRFTLITNTEKIKTHFQLDEKEFNHSPRYNIAPSQSIPVIINDSNNKRIIPLMRWGLTPHWAKEQFGYKMINARSEAIEQKPTFRDSFLHRRCLIPADGFYEWKKQNGSKLPMRIILHDKHVFAFAAIWDYWNSAEGTIYTCSIITTTANDYIKEIHDRIPVILAKEQEYKIWLDNHRVTELKELLKPFHGELIAYPVSTQINSPKVDNQMLIEMV